MAHISDYLLELASKGRHQFTASEIEQSTHRSKAAVKLALSRLARKGEIASPARGVYIIVRPEYRRLGCLPPDQFIPELMEHFGLDYYVGLLSAAQYHGAAHHRPQTFQVLVAKNRKPIACGAVRVNFFARKRVADVPFQMFNTPRGHLRVSTPEATAIDLVGYADRIGGLDHVATVLAELAERIDSKRLVEAAHTAPAFWSQRLGYLLERIGEGQRVADLKCDLRKKRVYPTLLVPGVTEPKGPLVPEWQLYVNAEIEAEG